MNQRSRTDSKPSRPQNTHSGRPLVAAFTALALFFSSCLALRAQPTDVSVNPSSPPGPTTFQTIQAAIDAVAAGGTVHVAPAIYVEDIVVNKALTLLGPNAGKAGMDTTRGAEAVLMPLTDDAANGQIIYVAASGVTIDGFLFNGDNPSLTTGYSLGAGTPTAEANTSAAVQNTYFWTTGFAPVDHLRIQNNIIRNIAYNGIYVEVALGSANGFNYVLNNKFEMMWEGLQTYAVHSVISNNTFVGVNRGLSLHGTTTAAPAGFTPVIANNTFTIGEWWPAEIPRVRTEGIWVNYRRDNAAALTVSSNVVNTPVAAPAGKTIRGLYALNVNGKGSVTFIGNTVNGGGNCMAGLTVALTPKPGAVSICGGTLSGISEAGVLATTKDLDWGTGDAFVTVSNVSITMTDGAGAVASQDASTPTLHAQVKVSGDSSISGGTAGVRVAGANASAILDGNPGSITANQWGLQVNGGKAFVQNSNLSGNSQGAIQVANNGVVDAGDCTGGNITGLGSSSGGNNLSGYGFDGAHWAIQNLGAVAVRAYQNTFGAGAGNDIADALSGPVQYSQTPLVATSPTDIIVQCVGDIPVITKDYPAFVSLGGLASASQIASISYTDSALNPPVGDQTVTRTWTVVDVCGQSGTCQQSIHVVDTTAPTIVVPAAVAVDQDAGQCYTLAAHVDLGTPFAADNCGIASIVNDAPAHFPIGLTLVTWTVRDINGLTASAEQVVTVRDTTGPVIITPLNLVRGVDAGNTYATVAFTTDAMDCSSFNLVANPVSGSHFPLGVNRVNLTATDSAGNLSTSSFTITVVNRPSLVLDAYSHATGAAVLSVTGPSGTTCGLEATSDFVSWTPLTSGAVPFQFTDNTGAVRKFYRAVYRP